MLGNNKAPGSEPCGPRLQSQSSQTLDFASRVVSSKGVAVWTSVVF